MIQSFFFKLTQSANLRLINKDSSENYIKHDSNLFKLPVIRNFFKMLHTKF